MSNLQAKVEVLVDTLPGAGSLVTRLNQLIASSCPGNRFITLFFGVVEPATGEMIYCNAGHNP
ncbi:MAG TPA: hypothetical protein DEH78_18785, partial [Solibacterales bacterium]|nr:hypothetical protein [Bryobacterales bacterium]